MRINYSNFKSLLALEEKDIVPYTHGIYLEEQIRTGRLAPMQKAFSHLAANIHRRFYVTKPFLSSVNASKDKLFDMDLWQQVPEDTGILLHENGWFMYHSFATANPEDVKLSIFVFTKQKYVGTCSLKCSGEYAGNIDFNTTLDREQGDIISHMLITCLSIIAFIHFCDIETKMILAGGKDYWKGEKFLNETKKEFLILDYSWYTQIAAEIKGTVSGHFKWQHYGPGNSLMKLIWVSDYEREVVRRAKKDIYL